MLTRTLKRCWVVVAEFILSFCGKWVLLTSVNVSLQNINNF